MKKNILTILAAGLMLASCGKVVVPSNSEVKTETTSSETESSSEIIPVCEHTLDNIGNCTKCGEYVGKTLKIHETTADEDPEIQVFDKKAYFKFNSQCPHYFYIDEDHYRVPVETPDDEFKPLIASIEVYKEGALDTDIYDTLGVVVAIEELSGDKFYRYWGSVNLEKDTIYYVVVNLVNDMDTLELYVHVAEEHYAWEMEWTDNEDHTQRSTTYVCDECGGTENLTETYIYEVTLPEIVFESGKTYYENAEKYDYLIIQDHIGILMFSLTDGDMDAALEPGTCSIEIGVFLEYYYCFHQEKTVVKDSKGNTLTPNDKYDGEYSFSLEIEVK